MKRAVSADRKTKTAEEPVEILTSDEQERVLQELRDSMASQNKTIRMGFGILFYFVAAIYVFCLLSFFYEPWSLVHQQRFEFVVLPPALLMYYGVSSFIFSFSAIVCQRGRGQVPVIASWAAVVGSALCLAGWGWAFYSAHVNNIALYWLPFAPLGGLLISLYVDGDISSLAAEMVTLESKKYDVKDV